MCSFYALLNLLLLFEYRKHPCLVCGKEFLLKTSLSHHQRQKHPNNLTEKHQRQISCNICHKQFTMQRKLQRHMQIHTQVYCSLCNTFTRGGQTSNFIVELNLNLTWPIHDHFNRTQTEPRTKQLSSNLTITYNSESKTEPIHNCMNQTVLEPNLKILNRTQTKP